MEHQIIEKDQIRLHVDTMTFNMAAMVVILKIVFIPTLSFFKKKAKGKLLLPLSFGLSVHLSVRYVTPPS